MCTNHGADPAAVAATAPTAHGPATFNQSVLAPQGEVSYQGSTM